MIDEFVQRWEENKEDVRERLSEQHPETYQDIVEAVVEVLSDGYESPDPNRIQEIDWGDYQGQLVYLVGATGYQPSTYWYVRVWYGSCSGCDTLLAIRGWGDETPTDEQVDDYMKLALHVVQRMKKMDWRAV